MNFYSFLIFLISILFVFKLPRIVLFENLNFFYRPILNFENFIWDIRNLKDDFEKLVLKDGSFKNFSYGISFIPPIYPKEIILNFGRKDGISYNDILSIKNIIIGRIIEVNENSSRAITIYNENFSASILIKRSNYLGIFEGGDIPRISYISEGSDIKEGDTILTSSFDGLFPYGLFVGIVGKVIEKKGTFESREVVLPYKFERITMFNIIKLF